jgi:hypothetical protein
MPQYTDIYGIPWYELKDTILESIEKRRAVTIDNQLYSFATIFGNGVISGWDVEGNLSGFQVSITAGKGMIRWMAGETDATEVLQSLPANRSMDNPIYIYVIYTNTTAQDRSVTFFFNTDGVAPAFALLLAKVATDATGVIEVDTSVKETLEFFANIAAEVINHIHIGGDDNPSPIDLVSHVTGKLSQSMIDEIDASKISGQINPERLAQVQHNTLSNIGKNTHNQIDTLLSLLNTTSVSLMGDVAFANLLQLILAVKHFWTNIDEYLPNMFAFIPGITPDSYIDLINTSVTIDKNNHKLISDIGGVREAVIKTYTTEEDFDKNIENNNIVISSTSGGMVYLSKPSTQKTIEDFTSVTDWAHEVTSSDGSSITTVDSYGQYEAKEAFTVKFYKTLSSEDWTDYNRIEFNFRISYTEHGPVYFQIKNGSSYNTAVQLIGENATTDGWVAKSINLLSMDRDDITEIFFYTEVLVNDINKVFDFDIDDINVINDIYYSSVGTINFIFNTEQTTSWENIYWDADTSGDSAIEVKTRSANTLSDLDYVTFSPSIVTSGGEIVSSDSRYLEVQLILNSSSDQLQTPILNDFDLSYTTAAVVSQKVVDTQSDWENNKDNSTNLTIANGQIDITTASAVGAYQFLHSQGGSLGDETIEGIDSNRNRISSLVVGGSKLPISPQQANNGLGAAFYNPLSVQRLNSRGYMVADTGNHRVIEIDEDGNLIWGALANNVSTTDILKPLTSTYNPNNRELSISFNRNINADSLDLSKISILKGSTFIRLANGSETASQENLNFIKIILSITNANLLVDSTGDISISIEANAISDTDDTNLALSYNVDVFEGDIYWVRINSSVHAYKTNDGNCIISHVGGSGYLDSIVELDNTAKTAWSFSEVSFSTDYLGSTEKNGNEYIVADSGNKRIITIDEDESIITFNRSFSNYVSRATKVANGNFLLTISDGVGGSNSRIIEIDNSGDVIFEFGFGLIKNPTNAVKLTNGNYVVTM